MTSVSVQVTIESWGDYCGTRPKSHSQQMKKTVTIQETGGHLVLSEGIRTDRCSSPNPRIKTVLARRTETRWRRECQTPADDPKFERGVYTLNAVNNNRIEYTAQSRFDWTLKGDHCVATAHESRVFIRAQKTVGSQPAAESEMPSPLPDTEHSEDDTGAVCDDVGPVVRFELAPNRIKVGPGERFCFKVVASDNKGCPIKNMNLHWEVMQDGVEIEGLVTKAGCFKAGETAAESEGLYDVAVSLGAHIATAQINVLFEDLGDLFAARLSPLADIETTSTTTLDPTAEKQKKELSSTAAKNGPTPVVPIVPKPEKRITLVWSILFGVIAVGTVLGLFLLIGRLRRQTAQEVLGEFEDWPDLDEEDEAEKNKKNGDDDLEKNSALACPECGRIYKRNAKYCAYDKSTLISISKTPMDIPEGMICPKCHRGYEKDARFCPHDSEPLVQYSDWRTTKKPNPKG